MSFKLRDLFVLTVIAALAMPLIVQALMRARAHSRQRSCANNLRGIGISFYTYVGRDPQTHYCSGAPDFLRDGCIDTHGWVADTVSIGAALPNELLDPANPLRATETYEDMLTKNPKDADPHAAGAASGMCGAAIWNLVSGNESLVFAGTTEGTKDRAELLSRAFMRRGFNTNYAASWLLVRGANPRTIVKENRLCSTPVFRDTKSAARGTGPFTANQMDRTRVSSSNVTMLGCANPSGSVLSSVIGHNPNGKWSMNDRDSKQYLTSGERLASGFTNGPAFWNTRTKQIELLPGDAPLNPQIECERGEPTTVQCSPPTGTSPNGNDLYLQDTRAWRPVHNGWVNMLMFDGSIRSFRDLNGDGVLNPGFPATPNPNAKTKRATYANDRLELPRDQYFGGVFLNDIYYMNIFE